MASPSIEAGTEPRAGDAWFEPRRIPWQLTGYVAVLAVFALASVVPQWLAPMNPLTTNILGRLQPPGTTFGAHTYLLGTDALGRDELSRLIYAARGTLITALAAVVLGSVFGSLLGVVAGYYRGAAGVVFMRLADIVLSIPFLLLAVLAVAVAGPTPPVTVAVLCATRWPLYTRIAYGQVLQIRESDHVQAARALGAGPARIIWRHIFPLAVGPLTVMATLELGTLIMFEAALSFLGLGVQPPAPSWGGMLSDGQNYIATAWWLITFPGIAVFLVVLTFNRLGDYIQDRLGTHVSG